ncbi:carbohydrate porin [Pseudobacteriovorax antillogorgiicola]|uniref:Maltoporin (Phage lambda and maltose receptor) n=1 Tax=Pseudobacteriovorax antillogorgiicola TaxID=1513793 RepID=A0A1Y6CI25_9BACT|nr:carbohydrate porin [Pseudobacteriovorax antillogorgiicola]TCS48292.1 maltoporin [Pseudobacteriovorax antillogorgiicola]SMF56868.1 Maltoporin (phage lambda and maltose receptor) [Pseudobacteriovorax antillogorgiicola]
MRYSMGRGLFSVLSGALWLTTAAWGAGEFEFNGYLRTGTNYSEGMTKGVCYRENVSAIGNPGRFGNECDNLLEIVGKSYLFGSPNNSQPWVTLNVTGQLFYAGDRSEEAVTSDDPGRLSTGNETIFQFPNTYVEMGNVVGRGSIIWAGRRWYRRLMFYQSDIFTLNNNGNGFGVYDIEVGPGKLHLAVMRRIENREVEDEAGNTSVQAGPSYNTFDARYSTQIGALPIDFIYLHQRTGAKDAYGDSDESYERAQGNLFALFSEYYGAFSNRAYIGYGTGLFGQGADYHIGAGHLSYSGFGLTQTEWEAREEATSFRVINEVGLELIPDELNFNISALYSEVTDIAQEQTDDDGNVTGYEAVDGYNYSIGLKPQYFINKHWSFVIDLAHTMQERDDYTEPHTLNKGTFGTVIRPQIKSMPGAAEFRLYATRASWDKDANYPGDKGSALYGERGSGNTYGVQVDVAW